jgi:hypothetical protein
MELDDFKTAWTQFDRKLTENLKLNEELLKKLNLDKSKREMSSPLNYEIGSVIITFLLVLFLGGATIRFASDLRYSIPGLIATLLTLFGFVSSLIKINVITKIDFNNSSVIALQKSINILKQKVLLYRKVEYYVFPIYAISFAPVFLKAYKNIDIFSKSPAFFIWILLALIIYYPLAIWYYKIGYDSKLKNTSDFLDELSRFEKE